MLLHERSPCWSGQKSARQFRSARSRVCYRIDVLADNVKLSLSAVTCGGEERQIVCRVWNLRRDTWMERESMSVGCVGRRRHGGPPWLRVACEVGRRSDFRGRLVSCPGPSPGQLGGNHGLQVGGLWVVVDGPERCGHRALERRRTGFGETSTLALRLPGALSM